MHHHQNDNIRKTRVLLKSVQSWSMSTAEVYRLSVNEIQAVGSATVKTRVAEELWQTHSDKSHRNKRTAYVMVSK